jgi:hypothetical protein
MTKQEKDSARRTLARHIVAVLKHPDTPVRLYNAMVGELNDWANYDWETVTEVERALEWAANNEKGDAS